MPRFFTESDLADGAGVDISGQEARHIYRVMRLGKGDRVRLFNGREYEADAVITSATAGGVKLAIEKAWKAIPSGSPRITLLNAILKPDKMDQVIRHSVELGVEGIVPFASSRTVVDIKTGMKKLDRWGKIVIQAAKQCGRISFPKVHPPVSFLEAVVISKESGLKIIMWEDEEKFSLGDLHKSHLSPDSIAVAVGPEGGFAREEVELAKSRGFISAGMGKRVLRSETASLAVLSILQYELGDMG
jgi:16S rRNA (uracil1498-N3)-methyltransferase